MFKVGDKVLRVDPDDPSGIAELTVTKVGKDTVQCGEDTYYPVFLWPAKYRNELITILTERQRLKKAYDDSMKLFYKLKNKISREQ